MKKILSIILIIAFFLAIGNIAKADDDGKKFKGSITTLDMYYSEKEKKDIQTEACPATIEFDEGYHNRMIISISDCSESAVKKAKEKIVNFLKQKKERDRQGKICK